MSSDKCTMDDRYSVVMLGPPGSGKGTQVEYLVGLGFYVVSVGDLLRKHRDTLVKELSCTVGEVLSSGKLLPDEFICNFVKDNVLDVCDNGKCSKFLFDGFPRTLVQASCLNDILSSIGVGLRYAFNFCITDSELVNRITGRFSCKTCGRIYNRFSYNTKVDGICDKCGSNEFVKRDDDNEESLKTRLSQYHEKSRVLIDFYDKIGLLRSIDATKPSCEISRELYSVLGCVN